jgi:hypothetical protein
MDAAAGELGEAVADYCRDLPLGLCWVCKNPRSHYVLPFLDQVVDGLRYIHVVRDGRDMAFSKQTGTLRQHCELLVGKPWGKAGAAHIAFKSWEVSNLRAAGYGEQRMGTRYLCVRLEQLCEPTSRDASALAQFLGAPLDRVASAFEPQESFGRWRRAHVDKALAKLFCTSTALTHWGYA